MTSDKLAGQECSTQGQVYQLSDDEIASLRKEMHSAGEWMMNELKRRQPGSEGRAISDQDRPDESPVL